MKASPKPFFVLYVFYMLTAIIIYFLLGSDIAITYSITGFLSPFVIVFIYWLTGEL